MLESGYQPSRQSATFSRLRGSQRSGAEGLQSATSESKRRHARPYPARIALVNLLEEGGALLRVKGAVVGCGKRVEHVLNGELELRAGSGFLPPVEHQQCLSRFSKSRATFFTSARAAAFKAGAGRVRMSKITGSSSVTSSDTQRGFSSRSDAFQLEEPLPIRRERADAGCSCRRRR